MRPSEIFRARVKQVREGRGMLQEDVAKVLKSIDNEHDPTVSLGRRSLSKIENGQRAVTLDEAFAIAAVLDVAPVHLFVPIDDKPEDEAGMVHVVPRRDVPPIHPRSARAWVRGHKPLPYVNVDDRYYVTEVPDAEFRLSESTSYRVIRDYMDQLPYHTGDWNQSEFLNELRDLIDGLISPRYLSADEMQNLPNRPASRDQEGN